MRVLVVDDYPGAADVVCVLLRLLGQEATPAKSGAETLARATELQPDIVILDLGLPDQSGYEVARTLRERQGKRLFIAAMTGWNHPDDSVRSLAAGIDMHMLKPASAENLQKILDAAQQRLDVSGTPDPA